MVGSPLNNIGAQISPFHPQAGDTAAAAFQRLAASYPNNRNAAASAQSMSAAPAPAPQPKPQAPDWQKYAQAPNYMSMLGNMIGGNAHASVVPSPIVPSQLPLPTFNQLQAMMGSSQNAYMTNSPMAGNRTFQDNMRANNLTNLVQQYYDVIPRSMAAQLNAQTAASREAQQLAALNTQQQSQNVNYNLEGVNLLTRLIGGL